MPAQGYSILNREKGWTRLRRNPKHLMFARLRALKVQIDCESICWICGQEVIDSRTLDHIIPEHLIQKDSDIHPSNYWIAHSACNNFRGNGSVLAAYRYITKAQSDGFVLKSNGSNLKSLKKDGQKTKINKNNSVIELLKQIQYLEKHESNLLDDKVKRLEFLIDKRLTFLERINNGRC